MGSLWWTVACIVIVCTTSSGYSPPEVHWEPEEQGEIIESSLLRFYIFNLTNPDQFQDGSALPVLTEVGPFTYREKRVKTNMVRLNASSLQYDIRWSLHYIPELTGEGLSEDTRFTSANLPFWSISKGLSNLGFPKAFNDLIIDEVVEAGEKMYRPQVTFGESTFTGYNISIYTTILDDVTQGQTAESYPEFADGKFAFFKNTNGTIISNYTVESTKEAPLGRILRYKGYENLGFWNEGTECDRVEGSLDQLFFPRHISKSTILKAFFPGICRSARLEFVQEDVFRGIPVYVFKFPLEQFSNRVGDDGKASCYCYNYANASNPQCLEPGLLDFSGCSKGAPLVGSFPHFLHSGQKVVQGVAGMRPNKSLHDSEVMIEPITGTPLYAVRRFQVNLHMTRISGVTYFENVTETILPYSWYEHILEVPSTTFTAVREKLARLKEASNKDMYLHEDATQMTGHDEVDDNTLFASRSGFPAPNEENEDTSSRNSSSQSNSGVNYTMNSRLLVAIIGLWLIVINSVFL